MIYRWLLFAGIKKVSVNLSDELVIVESSLPSSEVQQKLESTGRLVVFRGYGGTGELVIPANASCLLLNDDCLYVV